MAGKFRCILLLIAGLFVSSLSYAENTEIPSYEEGISLFDVEATLQPDGVLDIKENIHFQARNQQVGSITVALRQETLFIAHDSGCSLMGTLHC